MCFFFQAEDGIRDYKVTGVQTCALPIWRRVVKVLKLSAQGLPQSWITLEQAALHYAADDVRWESGGEVACFRGGHNAVDRKSTRLNSSHLVISYAVFCLKKKKNKK